MQIDKVINFFNIANITIKYFEVEHILPNSPVFRYNDYKISIRLTEGLFGVLGTKILAGKKGDVCLFAPDEIHFGRFTSPGIYRYIHIYIPMELCANLEKAYPCLNKIFDSQNPHRTNYVRGTGKTKERIIEIGENIVEGLKTSEDSTFSITTNIIQLLLICEKLYTKEKNDETKQFSPQTQFAIEYINDHFAEKITIEEMANKIGCSTVYLSKIFKKDTGKTIYTYLTEYRISKSTILLKEGCNVTETCYSVGFYDCSNFIRTFKKVNGISPYKYKKSV